MPHGNWRPHRAGQIDVRMQQAGSRRAASRQPSQSSCSAANGASRSVHVNRCSSEPAIATGTASLHPRARQSTPTRPNGATVSASTLIGVTRARMRPPDGTGLEAHAVEPVVDGQLLAAIDRRLPARCPRPTETVRIVVVWARGPRSYRGGSTSRPHSQNPIRLSSEHPESKLASACAGRAIHRFQSRPFPI